MRDFSGLLKIAGLEKRADPPNRGLNDPNPANEFSHEFSEEDAEALRRAWGNVARNEWPSSSNAGPRYIA